MPVIELGHCQRIPSCDTLNQLDVGSVFRIGAHARSFRGYPKNGLRPPAFGPSATIGRVALLAKALAVVLASASSATLTAPVEPAATEVHVPRGGANLAEKKGSPVDSQDDGPMLATLYQVHTGERAVLDAHSPTQNEFEALLADRATGEQHALDAQLLGLLRALAAHHPGSRIEVVSGYRSWKLNEMLRKKGHHVASHSQHSLGHACDFRLVPPGAETALDPRAVEHEVRDLGWDGGVGIYPTAADWFVHADVGPRRRWVN
jgi:uncharacterized protein YcbK (DUF882 family)